MPAVLTKSFDCPFVSLVNNNPIMSDSSSHMAAPLNQMDILRRLKNAPCVGELSLQVIESTDSTNSAIRQMEGAYVAVIAEVQSVGRGRRGRSWVATPYKNLLMSVSRKLDLKANEMSGLSLAAGVSVVRALDDCGIADVGLKWPNDIMVGRAKLGGLLVEVGRCETGRVEIVIGLGLNIQLADDDLTRIPGEAADLYRLTGMLHNRNEIAARVIQRFFEMLKLFEQHGFSPFRRSWELLHVFQNQPVKLYSPRGIFEGTAVGVDDSGHLVLRSDSGDLSHWGMGEVSSRG